MGYFDRFFAEQGRTKKFFSVIHVEGLDQTFRNTQIALTAGADGVFLINHSIDTDTLMEVYAEVRSVYPHAFIGINLLSEFAHNAYSRARAAHAVSALWADDSGITEQTSESADLLWLDMVEFKWPGYYFASTAFKGQTPVTNVSLAAQIAAKMAHVVVTSGVSTGFAPEVEKIAVMKAAIPDHPLAIASGMTLENISFFLPYADIFMVATGISDSSTELNPEKAQQMAEIIHSFR